MTEEALVGKLRSELAKELVSECQVVYLLVEVRKLLDLHNQAKAFNALNLHCNWAMHTRLNHDAARNLINELNKNYLQLNDGATAESGFKSLWNELGFDRFRKQFRAFLSNHQLPTDVCADGHWQTFLRFYSLVIQDCPLTCSQEGGSDLTFDKVVLTAVASDKEGTPSIKWELYRRDKIVADWTSRPGSALIGRIRPKK